MWLGGPWCYFHSLRSYRLPLLPVCSTFSALPLTLTHQARLPQGLYTSCALEHLDPRLDCLPFSQVSAQAVPSQKAPGQ